MIRGPLTISLLAVGVTVALIFCVPAQARTTFGSTAVLRPHGRYGRYSSTAAQTEDDFRAVIRPGFLPAILAPAAGLVVDVANENLTLPSDSLVRRHHQYAIGFASAAGLLVILVGAALKYEWHYATGAGIAALGAVAMGAVLQFSANSGIPALAWPPPRLWLGTFAGDFMLAVMLAAVGAVMLRPGLRRVLGAVLIAEVAWWAIPWLAATTGLMLGMAQHGIDADWLIFMGTMVGAIAAPAAAWSLAALSGALADRIVPRRA